jgi:3-oxoacyl-[acyl-carrier-protein] synthase-1
MTSSVSIFGSGLVSSVGLDLPHSAASVRAGLSRFSPIQGIGVYDEHDFVAPVAGSPVSLLTSGYVQQARWLRLAEKAVNDVLNSSPGLKNQLMGDTTSPLLVVWALPDVVSLFQWPEDQVLDLLNAYLLTPLSRRVGVPLTTPDNAWICEGNSSGPRAIRAIARSIASGQLTRALCIGVDSLLEPLCIQHLIGERRLKTAENPHGLMPGEAAAALLFESASSSTAPLLQLFQARHNTVSLDREPNNWRTLSAYDIGRELGRLIVEALSVLGDSVFYGDIYLDLNGEEWRSVVWSAAVVIIKASGKVDLNLCEYRLPATSWGDIGAASSVAAMALAAESFRRHYARSNLSLVCSVSDQGDVGVVLIGL